MKYLYQLHLIKLLAPPFIFNYLRSCQSWSTFLCMAYLPLYVIFVCSSSAVDADVFNLYLVQVSQFYISAPRWNGRADSWHTLRSRCHDILALVSEGVSEWALLSPFENFLLFFVVRNRWRMISTRPLNSKWDSFWPWLWFLSSYTCIMNFLFSKEEFSKAYF